MKKRKLCWLHLACLLENRSDLERGKKNIDGESPEETKVRSTKIQPMSALWQTSRVLAKVCNVQVVF